MKSTQNASAFLIKVTACVILALGAVAQAQDKNTAVYRTCPGCQQPLTCEDANQRILDTRAGDAEWAEPEGYCDRCRRSFFPSVQESGH